MQWYNLYHGSSRHFTKTLPVIGMTMMLSAVSLDALAQDPFTASITETFVMDSNPLAQSGNGGSSIYGAETNATFGYSSDGDYRKWATEIIAKRNQFNDSDFNSTDAYWNGHYKKLTDISQFDISARIDYDTTRTDESSLLGQDTKNNRRFAWTVNPSYKHNLSQRTDIAISLNWRETRYDTDRLTDYRTTSLSPSLNYKLTQLQTAMASLQARRYETLEGPDQTTDSFGPYFGWQYNFHPQYTVSVFGGMLGTRYDGYGLLDSNWDYNPIYALKLDRKGEQNTTSLEVSRDRQPYANGTDIDTTTFKAQNLTNIGELWSVSLGGQYRMSEQSDVAGNNFDSSLQESLSLNYNIGQKWVLSLSQKYWTEDYTDGAEDAERHIVKLSLKYNFNEMP